MKIPHLIAHKTLNLALIVLAIALSSLASTAQAQTTRTWNGGGGNANWSTSANWGGTAPVAGNTIAFGGILQTTTNNDLAADTSFAGINFTNSTANQSFTLGGNRITLGGNIVTTTLTGGVASATILDTINFDMILSGTRTITAAASSTNGNHHLTINGVISESGGSFGLSKNGLSGGILTLSALNTFTGTVTLTSGTISFNTIADTGTPSALGAGGAIVTGSGGGSTGTLLYTGTGSSTNRQIQIGTSTVTSTAGVIIQNDGTGALTYTNTNFNVLFATSTATKILTLQGSNTGNNLISGIIVDNNTAGGGRIAITKDGAGMWTLAGANTFTGGVTLSLGTLNLNNAGSGGTSSPLGTGTLTITGGAIDNTSGGALVLSTANAVAYNGSFTFNGSNDLTIGGIISIGGSSRVLTMNNGKTLTFGQLQWNSDADRSLTVTQGTGSGAKLVLGGFQLNTLGTATAARTRTITGTTNVSITGAIVDGNSFANNLTYSSSALLTLSAANSYTGTTTVSGGAVRLDNANALPGGVASTGGTSALLFSGSSTTGGVIGLTTASGDFTRSIVGLTPGATQVGWSNAGWGGFAAFGSDRTVNFGGAGTPTSVSWSSSGGILGGGLVLSDVTSDSTITVANPINLNNAGGTRTIQVNNGTASVDAIMSGVLSGTTTRLIKTGTGTLALTTTNTYGSGTASGTAGTTISAGTLQIGIGGTVGSISAGGDIDNNATLAFNRSDALSVSNIISGTGAISQIGAGTTTLTGTSSYSGSTTINAGVLQLGIGGTVGSIASTSGISNNATLAFNRSNALAVSANISGTGVVNQIGAGVTSLSGTNTYGGGTNVNTGGLTFLNTNAKPASGTTAVAAGATLGLGVAASGSFFTGTDVDNLFAGTLANVTNDVASLVGIDTTAGDFTCASSVPATTRGLTKLGANTLTLTGVNSYTGVTTISAGVLDVGTIANGSLAASGLQFANDSVLQGNGSFTRSFSGSATAGAGQIAGASGGFAAKGGTLTVNFGNAGATILLSNSNFRFGTNFVLGSATADNKVIVVNPLDLNQISRTITVNSGVGGDSAELQGAISESGGTLLGITKSGTGLLALSGTSTYTGVTTINAGTLQLGSGGTTGSIASTSGITNNTTLAFNRSNALSIAANISSTGIVNQIGAGITSLSGTNTYAGGTNVIAGTLSYLNTNAKPATGTTTVAAGATLGLGMATSGSFFTSSDVDSLFAGTLINVTNNATSNVGIDTTAGDFTYATSVSGTTRGLNKLGSNSLSLTGTNTYTGATIVTGGILRLDSAGALPGGTASTGGTSNLVMNGGVLGLTTATGDFTRGIGNGVTQVRWITDTVSGFAAFGGNRTINFGGSVTPSTVTWSNTGGVLGNGLILSDASSDSTITIINPIALNFVNSPRTVTVNDGSAAVDAVFAGALSSLTTSGNGTRLIKNGAGTLALTAANTYVSGSTNPGTTISAGTLQLGNGGTTGSISALSGTNITSDVSISSGAIFAFNRTDAGLVVPNLILGAGSVSQLGTGTTTLSNANTFSGGTSVTAGTLLVINTTGSATGTGAVTASTTGTLGGSGTIAPSGANAVSVSGTLSPGVAGTNDGVGTLTFTPANGSVKLESTGSVLFQLRSNGTNGLSLTYNPDGTINTISGTPSLTGSDRLVFASTGSGILDFSTAAVNSFDFAFVGGYTPALLDAFDLLDWNSLAVSGLSTGQLELPTLANPMWYWDTTKFVSDGVIAVAATVVPEPSRAMLLLVGLGSLLFMRRRPCGA